ncbi:MAG: TauD/TfdA family dioxygenase, partial [Hyphomicrobiales bacterium]|nr:TauD/TfdA family dioxygenase [Hyphomicrobiales bacterium]
MSVRLKRGEMVVFDYRRVLHGRQAFDSRRLARPGMRD